MVANTDKKISNSDVWATIIPTQPIYAIPLDPTIPNHVVSEPLSLSTAILQNSDSMFIPNLQQKLIEAIDQNNYSECMRLIHEGVLPRCLDNMHQQALQHIVKNEAKRQAVERKEAQIKQTQTLINDVLQRMSIAETDLNSEDYLHQVARLKSLKKSASKAGLPELSASINIGDLLLYSLYRIHNEIFNETDLVAILPKAQKPEPLGFLSVATSQLEETVKIRINQRILFCRALADTGDTYSIEVVESLKKIEKYLKTHSENPNHPSLKKYKLGKLEHPTCVIS